MNDARPLITRLRKAAPWVVALSASAGTLTWAALPLRTGNEPPSLEMEPQPAISESGSTDTQAASELDLNAFARSIVRPRETRAALVVQPPEPTPPPPLPPPLELLGFINSEHAGADESRRAILYLQDQDLLRFVGIGERVGDARLVEIDAVSVRVEHGGHQHVLMLRRGTP